MTLRLLETMRAERGRVARWGLHRARLAASARALGVPLDLARVEDAVARALADAPDGRLRLTVAPDGTPDVAAGPLGAGFATARLDPEPFAEAGSLLCRHKTTRRDPYERRYRAARDAGADEAILVRADGRVVEGTRTSVWVEHDGRLWTPPLSSGGLPGVERAHLLAQREDTGERELTAGDVVAADRVWLSNAVVGLTPVRLLPAASRPR